MSASVVPPSPRQLARYIGDEDLGRLMRRLVSVPAEARFSFAVHGRKHHAALVERGSGHALRVWTVGQPIPFTAEDPMTRQQICARLAEETGETWPVLALYRQSMLVAMDERPVEDSIDPRDLVAVAVSSALTLEPNFQN